MAENDIAAQFKKIRARLEDEGVGQVTCDEDDPNLEYKVKRISGILNTPVSQSASVLSVISGCRGTELKSQLNAGFLLGRLPKVALPEATHEKLAGKLGELFVSTDIDVFQPIKGNNATPFPESEKGGLMHAMRNGEADYLNAIKKYYPFAGNPRAVDEKTYDFAVSSGFIGWLGEFCRLQYENAPARCYHLAGGKEERRFLLGEFVRRVCEGMEGEKDGVSEVDLLYRILECGEIERKAGEKELLAGFGTEIAEDCLETGFSPVSLVLFACRMDDRHGTCLTAALASANEKFRLALLKVLDNYGKCDGTGEFPKIAAEIRSMAESGAAIKEIDSGLRRKFGQRVPLLHLMAFYGSITT